MNYYIIKFGMGGGFNSYVHEVIKAANQKEADDIAYEAACEDYENYAGMHGVSSQEEIAEEHGLSFDIEEDVNIIEEIYNEEREGWIIHWAKPYTDELAKSLKYEHYENSFEDDLDFGLRDAK